MKAFTSWCPLWIPELYTVKSLLFVGYYSKTFQENLDKCLDNGIITHNKKFVSIRSIHRTIFFILSQQYFNINLNFLFFESPSHFLNIRRVWRYQRSNQNPHIEEEQTTQWPKEKVQKDKQRSTKHTYKTKDRVTRTPLKTGGELRCSGKVSSSWSTNGTCRVNLVTNPVIRRDKTVAMIFQSLWFSSWFP